MAFLLLSIILLNAIALWMPKKITKVQMYASGLFAFFLAITTDVVLDLKYDLYGYFDHGLDIAGFLPLAGLYPAVNVIFLNMYMCMGRRWTRVALIAAWTAFAVIYEWAADWFGFFYHNGWKLWYSVPTYPVLFMILLLNLKFIIWLEAKDGPYRSK